MSLFWRRPREERRRLVRTLYELGPTTVPGLSAALSWPEKRTVKVVRELIGAGEGGVVFHPSSGRVEIPRPRAVERRADDRPVTPHGPTGPSPSSPPLPTATSPVLSAKWGGQSICPNCSSTMELTATGEALVCRDCGRLSNLPKVTRGPPAEVQSMPHPVVAASGGPVADRKLQEMFAAYVTSQPLLCPKCRTPLQHRGLGAYGCPACGQGIRFSTNGLGPAPVAPTPPAR